jgi:sec-independent protein translocase protein TatA
MGRIGGGELLLILLIALLIFGPSKLADMGKGLGQGLKNFKKGMSQDGVDDDPNPEAPIAKPEPPKALPAGAPVVTVTAHGETVPNHESAPSRDVNKS